MTNQLAQTETAETSKVAEAHTEAPEAPKRPRSATSSRKAVQTATGTATETKPKRTRTKKTQEAGAEVAKASRGQGIGALARSLIVEHQDWPHAKIAHEVNTRIPGAQASEKSVRWYAHDMKKRGIQGTERRRTEKS